MSTTYYVRGDGSDSNAGTTNSSGGAFLTPGKAGSVIVGGDTLYIKNSTYAQANSSANVSGGYLSLPSGTSTAPTQVIGFNSTPGDLDNISNFANFPIIQTNGSGDVTCMRATGDFCVVRNLILDATTVGTYGIYVPGDVAKIINCKAINFTTQGFYFSGLNSIITRCYATGGTYGINMSGGVVRANFCVLTGCTGAGIFSDVSTVGCVIYRCLIYNNTGGSTSGINSASHSITILFNDIYNNGSHGILFSGSGAGDRSLVMGNIITNNGGNGINSDTTNYTVYTGNSDYNDVWNNGGSGNYSQWPTGQNDISVDPGYVGGSPFDFTPTNTALIMALTLPH